MEFLCCAKTRPSLFANQRQFRAAVDEDTEEPLPEAELKQALKGHLGSARGAPLDRKKDPWLWVQHNLATGVSVVHKLQAKGKKSFEDLFEQEGQAQADAPQDRQAGHLLELAVRLRGPVRRRPQASEGASASAWLPATMPDEVHLELIPKRHGGGLEPWISGEFVLWRSEHEASQGLAPLASTSLMKLAKVSPAKQEDTLWVVKLRVYDQNKDIKSEEFVFDAEERARSWADALTEVVNAIRGARRLNGRSNSMKSVPSTAS